MYDIEKRKFSLCFHASYQHSRLLLLEKLPLTDLHTDCIVSFYLICDDLFAVCWTNIVTGQPYCVVMQPYCVVMCYMSPGSKRTVLYH